MAENASDADRLARLMQLAGRCLVRYQQIEHALKLLLPHLAVPGVDITEHAPKWREFLDSKHTLGPLMERFKVGLTADRPEDAYSYLGGVVEERNDLVHHFFTKPGTLTGSSDALEHAISELKRRLENALPLEQALIAAAAEFIRELERTLDSDARSEVPRAL